MSPYLDDVKIQTLLKLNRICEDWPWSTDDDRVIDDHLKAVVVSVCAACDLQDRSEFDDYGSGYASFVDVWLYRDHDVFRFDKGNCFWGLVLLFSRLSNCYVIGQGQKIWHEQGGSSYLPSFEFVDDVRQPALLAIVEDVCRVVDSKGFRRLRKEELSETLAEHVDIPTILGDPPFRHFDALFFWAD